MRRFWLPLLLAVSFAAQGAIEAYRFDDPEKEARYKALIDELRCLVCQNQNLADSNAELAQDMRRKTYEMVQQGASNEEVVTFMVSRYGDFVLYRPPLRSSTALLWVGPFIIFAIGVGVLISFIRKRGRERAPELSPEQIARAEQLLNQGKDRDQ
ncbi:MAG: cytochrome c-type biogenesis protein [Candidatus Sedimenticola endophacoides]